MTDETKTQDAEEVKHYLLTELEQRTMWALARRVELERLNVFRLNRDLEQALKTLEVVEAEHRGALTLLTNAHNLPGATLSADCTILKY